MKKKLTKKFLAENQEAIAYLQNLFADKERVFTGKFRKRPLFNSAHPFLQAIIQEFIKDAPAIIEAIIQLIIATKTTKK
jgi:hypothetical protein